MNVHHNFVTDCFCIDDRTLIPITLFSGTITSVSMGRELSMVWGEPSEI